MDPGNLRKHEISVVDPVRSASFCRIGIPNRNRYQFAAFPENFLVQNIENYDTCGREYDDDDTEKQCYWDCCEASKKFA
jgi:hypothetical protein